MAANPAAIPNGGEARATTAPVEMSAWLDQRQALTQALEQALRDGFQAVAAFRAPEYLDCIERQEGLCRALAALDRAMPRAASNAAVRRTQVDRLRAMNLDLRQLAEVQGDLIAHGGRSVRCFQRVWALGAPEYRRPEGR